jgi:predicted metal-dependent peptidase
MPAPSNMSTQDRIKRAQMRLLVTEPFFGTLMLRLKLQEVQPGEMPHDTMATDGQSLFWCAPYVTKQSEPLLIGLLAHEVMHVALIHHLRRGSRNPEKWNVACDGAIDHILKDAGMTVPDSFADMPKFAWMRGLTAEAIYDRLPDDPDPGGCPGPGPTRPGGVMDAPPSVNPGQEEQEIKVAVKQAAMAQTIKAKGNTPAWMKDVIEQLMAPVIRWQDLLREFVTSQVPTDFTWARPNKRHLYAGLFLPTRKKEGLGELVIYFDTSGSCWHEGAQFFGECNAIIEDLKPELVHLVLCDTNVGMFTTYEPGDTLDPQRVGCGGSDFRPAFREVEERGIEPVCAIVLSDMDIDFPKHAPTYPVIGISTTESVGPAWMRNVKMVR